MGQHQLGEMGLSKAIGVQMKELGVAGWGVCAVRTPAINAGLLGSNGHGPG